MGEGFKTECLMNISRRGELDLLGIEERGARCTMLMSHGDGSSEFSACWGEWADGLLGLKKLAGGAPGELVKRSRMCRSPRSVRGLRRMEWGLSPPCPSRRSRVLLLVLLRLLLGVGREDCEDCEDCEVSEIRSAAGLILASACTCGVARLTPHKALPGSMSSSCSSPRAASLHGVCKTSMPSFSKAMLFSRYALVYSDRAPTAPSLYSTARL